MNAKKILGWSAGAAVALTLLACGGSPSDGTSSKRESGVAAPGSSASAEAKEDGPIVAKFGLDHGLTFVDEKIDVSISKPSKYKPSPYMDRVPKGSIGFVMTVVVVNNNTEAIKVQGLQISATVGKEGAEATEIFDSEAGLRGNPDSAILPGKKATFKIGFTAPTTEAHPTIDLTVTPYDQGGSHTGLFSGTY